MVLVDELRQYGLEVIFLNYKSDKTPAGRLLLLVQSMIAEYERTKIRERCRRGRLFAARAGQVSVLGGAPFGYRYITKQELSVRGIFVQVAWHFLLKRPGFS